MSAPHRRSPWMVAAGLVVALAAFAGWWWSFRHAPVVVPADDPLAAVPLSSSPFLNTRPDARYVGSAACVRCHIDDHRTYQRIGMSRSTSEVRADGEPPDATFDHAASGLRFEVSRRGGQLWHRESLLGSDPADATLGEFALKYGVGSGRHARTYLVEADGFLVESPLTWYSSRKQWGMSPGYDGPVHKEFERPIGTPCLFCHVGRFETEDNSLHRHRILEPAVSCERCHGPGSLHVARMDQAVPPPPADDGTDFTIVNPTRLPRDLAEAVCQQCHLGGDAAAVARGRKMTDYRPGLPIEEFFHVYSLAGVSQGMSVTGHVGQLHQSKCYQRSDSLTCATCHNPHGFPPPERRVAYYRSTCLSCHAEEACKVDPVKRQKESPENSCVRCHMPTGKTDIPHVAFSNHRIAVHAAEKSRERRLPAVNPLGGREGVEPFHDLSRLSEADRKRSMGLAYAKVGSHQEIAHLVRPYNLRANKLLGEAWEAGLRDGPVASALAVTNYRTGRGDIRPYAEAALADPELEGEDQGDVLFLLADEAFKRGQYAEAADRLRKVTRLRRTAADWTYLSKCERLLGRDADGVRSLEKASAISPATVRLRQELIELYRSQGNPERAEWHRRRLPAGAKSGR